jgi:hypothetical protein
VLLLILVGYFALFLPSSLFNGVPRLLLLLSGRAGGVLAELGRLCVRGGLHRQQHVRDQLVLARRAHLDKLPEERSDKGRHVAGIKL